MSNAGNVYPLTRPSGRTGKVTHQLIADVAAALARHGFPPPAGIRDLARLQRALDRFAYGPAHEAAGGMTAVPRVNTAETGPQVTSSP